MQRLTGAINAAIGKYHYLLHGAVGIVVIVAVGTTKHRSRLVIAGICKHTARALHVGGSKHILALIVGSTLVGLLLAISHLLLYLQLGSRYWLSCSGIHHHIANFFARLSLGYGKHLGNMIQRAYNLSVWFALYLYQIHAHGQSLQLYRVFKQLVIGVFAKAFCLVYHGLTLRGQYLLQVLVYRWRQLGIAVKP